MQNRSGRGWLGAAIVLIAAVLPWPAPAQSFQGPSPAQAVDPAGATFRSGVNVVSISAVVRDTRGRVVSTLTQADFEVIDGDRHRAVMQFHSDPTAPASVAILIDGSGSMALSAAREQALGISTSLLGLLTPQRDSVAVLSFDTRLLTLCEFTGDFERVRAGLRAIEPYGSTSLYDAVAGAAAQVADRTRNRRAVVVVTDGSDTTSAYLPEDVAWMASTIDVPVYVFAVGSGLVHESPEKAASRWERLAALARATGGDLFLATSPALVAATTARIADELRHQYVLTFEPAPGGGVRALQVRARRKGLRVTARAWYRSDQGER